MLIQHVYDTLIKSEIVEDTFADGLTPPGSENCGTNRTGTYSVSIKLNRKIPQLLPIMGKRVRIYYPGIQKLCPNCFGPHPKHVCQSKRVQWRNYVSKFIADYKEIPACLYGKWSQSDTIELQKGADRHPDGSTEASHEQSQGPSPPVQMIPAKVATREWVRELDGINIHNTTMESLPSGDTPTVSTQMSITSSVNGPTKENFKVPKNRLEHESFVTKLVQSGLTKTEAEQALSSRRAAFNKACREYKKESTKAVKSQSKKSNKTSKNACPSTQSNAD